MKLRTIEFESFDQFRISLNAISDLKERSANLLWFYMEARYGISKSKFLNECYCDGSNDGGIDGFLQEGRYFHILQSKCHTEESSESYENIEAELNKFFRSTVGVNPNKRAEEFFVNLERNLNEPRAQLEYIWLTTNRVSDTIRERINEYAKRLKEKAGWDLDFDVHIIDSVSFENIVHDKMRGFVPYTGRKELRLIPGEYMRVDDGPIDAVVCNVKAFELLSWFESQREIKGYLQKNVRESLGDSSKVNAELAESFKKSGSYFWYKHNGIIIFVDSIEINQEKNKIYLQNPQIVNGAQTINQLFKENHRDPNPGNPAKILVRFYRLTYEGTAVHTYDQSIPIIKALNSQNQIKPSDLCSTDPRQVILENRLKQLSAKLEEDSIYLEYIRKRTDEKRRATKTVIFMDKLALIYSVCKNNKPHEGVTGGVQSYFEEKSKYENTFPFDKIKKRYSDGDYHIVYDYILCWYLYHVIVKDVKSTIKGVGRVEAFPYLKWFLLVDLYSKIIDWRNNEFTLSTDKWPKFIFSEEFLKASLKYCKDRFSVIYEHVFPKGSNDPHSVLKLKEASNKLYSSPTSINEFKAAFRDKFLSFKKTTNAVGVVD